MKKWLLLAAAVPVALIGIAIVIGLFTPVKHVGIARATYARAPDEVWPLVTDLAKWPEWNGGTMERLPDRDGRAVWAYTDANGRIASEIAEVTMSDGEGRMVTRIADEDLPFGGTWTWEIEPAENGGSHVSITENGEIYNPFFRFMARWFFGYTGTMERFLENLGTKLGEDVTPRTEWHHATAVPSQAGRSR